MKFTKFTSIFFILFSLPLSVLAQSTTEVIDNFQNQTVGANLSKFSLWSSSNAQVTYTASTDMFQGSMSARIKVNSSIDGGWITNSYTIYASQRNWSSFNGFRVKVHTDRMMNLSFTFTDMSNEPWLIKQSGGIAYTRRNTENQYFLNSSNGMVELPSGFEGEILIPFSSLAVASWYTGTKNNVFETAEIKNIQFGFSSTGSAGSSVYLDDISVYNSSESPTGISISGIETGYAPLDANINNYIQFSAKVLNDLNLIVESNGINWQLSPENQGVTIDNSGLVKISKQAVLGNYSIKAYLDNSTVQSVKTLTIAPKSSYIQNIESRINNRTFPSLHMAWNGIDDGSVVRNSLDDWAKHDLMWHNSSVFGLLWQKINGYEGLANSFTANSIVNARGKRNTLLLKNPNLLLFGCLSWIEHDLLYLPDNHEWWLRDGNGNKIKGWGEGNYQSYLLNTSSDSYQDSVVAKAKAIATCGVFDGIMIDCWKDTPDYVKLLAKIRAAVGNEIMIIVNSNMFEIPNSAQYVNGLFMECYRGTTTDDWCLIENTLVWAERSLRMPRVNNLETWAEVSRTSATDLQKMRATTCLSLTRSNGYCLFTDDNALPVGDHLHNFYDFWIKRLGKYVAEGFKRSDGGWQREFENGSVVYNPTGNNTITVNFDSKYTSTSTGISSTTHQLKAYDGDLFIRDAISGLIADINQNNTVKVYPNPVTNYFIVEKTFHTPVSVTVYSVTGQKIRSYFQNETTKRYSLKDFPGSTFFVTISGNNDDDDLFRSVLVKK